MSTTQAIKLDDETNERLKALAQQRKAYYNARIRGQELTERPKPGEMTKSDFEARLRQVGNAVVGSCRYWPARADMP